MSSKSCLTDPRYLRESQYRNASNLDARIQLHRRFSTNPYGWFAWVFDHLDLPLRYRILELGCGPGGLWLSNLERVPEGWTISLSDFSAGMVQHARQNLERSQRQFLFAVADVQSIPFERASFDAVVANHTLHHVPDRVRALSEIRRVLRVGGRFYATTVGQSHMGELWDLLKVFDPSLETWGTTLIDSFTLENGGAQLGAWFPYVSLHRYEDTLVVTEAAPLVEYVLSGIRLSGDRRAAFAAFVEKELAARGGAIRITKDSGIFAAY